MNSLMDTESPVTIVSLDFFCTPLLKSIGKEWEKKVKARLEPPAITFQNYGELNIV